MGSHPEKTWEKDGINWLKDEHMLPSQLPHAHIFRFACQSQWFGSDAVNQRLRSMGDVLLASLLSIRQVRENSDHSSLTF